MWIRIDSMRIQNNKIAKLILTHLLSDTGYQICTKALVWIASSQKTDVLSRVRNIFWVTISFKYCMSRK